MSWQQFHRLCCTLGLAQLASNRVVAEAFMAAHRDWDGAAGLHKRFGQVLLFLLLLLLVVVVVVVSGALPSLTRSLSHRTTRAVCETARCSVLGVRACVRAGGRAGGVRVRACVRACVHACVGTAHRACLRQNTRTSRFHEFENALLAVAHSLRLKMVPAASAAAAATPAPAAAGAADSRSDEDSQDEAEEACMQLLFVLLWKRLGDIARLTLAHDPTVRTCFLPVVVVVRFCICTAGGCFREGVGGGRRTRRGCVS
jgi:hypothetical protein